MRTTCNSAWRHVKQEWKPPVERLEEDQPFELLTARTGGGTCPGEVCRQGKCDNAPPPESCSPPSIGLGALHPALAEHGATLFGCFSAKMLATEASSTHGIWPAVASGLLWTRAEARAQTLDE